MTRQSGTPSPRGIPIGPRSAPTEGWYNPATNQVTVDSLPLSGIADPAKMSLRVRYLTHFTRTTIGRMVHQLGALPALRAGLPDDTSTSTYEEQNRAVSQLAAEQQLLWQWTAVAAPAARVLTQAVYEGTCSGSTTAVLEPDQEWLTVDGHPVPRHARNTDARTVVNQLATTIESFGPRTAEVVATIALDPSELQTYIEEQYDPLAVVSAIDPLQRLESAIEAVKSSPRRPNQSTQIQLADHLRREVGRSTPPTNIKWSTLTIGPGTRPSEQPLLDQPIVASSPAVGGESRTTVTAGADVPDIDTFLIECFDVASVCIAVAQKSTQHSKLQCLLNPHLHNNRPEFCRDCWGERLVRAWAFRIIRAAARCGEDAVRPLACPHCAFVSGECGANGCAHTETVDALRAHLQDWIAAVKVTDTTDGQLF